MKNVLKIFTIAILTFNVMPLFAVDTTSWISKIKNATSSAEAQKIFIDAVTATTNAPEYASIKQGIKKQAIEDAKKHAGISTPTTNNISKNDEPVATINVSGTIVNDTDGKPVQYVRIHVIGNDNLNSVSDANGKFTLNNVPINAKIRTQIVGYKSTTLDVLKKMEIKIQQENINLAPVEVTADCNGAMIDGKCVNLNFDDFENPEEETASDLPIEVQQYEKNKSELAKIEQSIAKISVGSVYMIPIEWKDNTEIQSALAKWKKACNENAKKPAHAKELSGEDDVEKTSVKCVIKTCDDGYTRTDNNTKCTKETKVEKQTECTNSRGGTWKHSACYCGDIIMTQGAICQDGKIVSKKAQNKESCNTNDETTWKGGKCVCNDPTKELTDEGCTEKVSNENKANSPVETSTGSENSSNDGEPQQQTETPTDTRTYEEKAQALAEKKQAFDDAKATEQSRENRMLTAATTAATGIGGMQLAQGLAEQKADKSAVQDMAAYIATMRCSYANGKSVKAGPDEIELPGGNDANLMKLRNEYFTLANDLKERKTALGMKAGIESEEILDKAATGLYDDESLGIDSGTYASLYRAQMLGSTTDQEQIDADKKTSKNRVIGGAVAAGVGVVGGALGNSLINGKLGEKIKELKDKRNSTKENNETINELKKGLKSAGMKNVNKLDLSKFDMTELSDMIHNTDFSSLNFKGQDATKLINTSNSTSLTSSLETLFEQQ